MPQVKILRDIPENEVDEVIKSFESEGCNAEKERQPNGKYTVRATCPDS